MTDGAMPSEYLSMLTYAAGTDIGMRREENQDAFGLLETDVFRFFFVADGMGGALGGAEASQLAIASVRGYLAGELTLNVDAVREAVEAANKTIFERGSSDPSLAGMGTTFVGIGFGREGMLVCNVGDSRAFRVRGGKVGQMTQDHTLVQELVNAGTITEAQAERHPISHMLTRSLGPAESVAVDCWIYPQKPEIGDVYVLCSDGLYNLVSPLEIAEMVLFNDGQEAASKLIDLANEAGGNDNITVIIIRLGPTSRIPVSELAIERIPQRPPEPEEPSPGGDEIIEPFPGSDHHAGSGLGSEFEDTQFNSGTFEAIFGALQQPNWWQVRTAVGDSRNIVIGGAVGLLLFVGVWLVKPEPVADISRGGVPRVVARDSLGVSPLVSSSLKANVADYVGRRRGELQSELTLIEDVQRVRGEADGVAKISQRVMDIRTQQQETRSVITQLRQDIGSLLDIRDGVPTSASMLLSFAEPFEATSAEVKIARAEASAALWKLRQTASAVVAGDGRGIANLAGLEESANRASDKLREVTRAEIDRRIDAGVRDLRTLLGKELDFRIRGDLIERFVKRDADHNGADGGLERYRTELVTVLNKLPS